MVIHPKTPERCDHRAAYSTPLISRTERGFVARCPQCGTQGPLKERSAEAARRALMDLVRRKHALSAR